MKKYICLLSLVLSSVLFFSGCLFGNRYESRVKTIEEFFEAGSDTIILKADLDFSGYEWDINAFKKLNIEGNGHTIKNIKISKIEGSDIGLLSSGSVMISNLNIENLIIEYYGNGSNIGGLMGSLEKDGYMILENVKISGAIYAGSATNVGGVLGIMNKKGSGTASIKFNNVDINIEVEGKTNVGGAIGKIGYIENHDSYLEQILGSTGTEIPRYSNKIVNVVNHGNITAYETCAGGIVGALYDQAGYIDTSTNYGDIKAKAIVGGLCGEGIMSGIDSSKNYGNVTSTDKGNNSEVNRLYVGGIIGSNKGTYSNCACTNNVSEFNGIIKKNIFGTITYNQEKYCFAVDGGKVGYST